MPPAPRGSGTALVPATVESSQQENTDSSCEAHSAEPHGPLLDLPDNNAHRNHAEIGDLQALKHEHEAHRHGREGIESTEGPSSRVKQGKGVSNGEGPRRFVPEPFETSSRSSKDKAADEKPHIKFKPQLIETTHSSSADRKDSDSKTPRKFTPILIDTARRTRRAGESTPSSIDVDKTEQGYTHAAREHRQYITGVATPVELDEAVDAAAVSDQPAVREISPLDGSSQRKPSVHRQHSFRCPDLDTIESSESDVESDTSSAVDPVQASPITASDSSFNEYKHATRARESVDEKFSSYFLDLEAKRAEKRLREQALAAFPNPDFRERIDHYVDSDKDSDSDVSMEDEKFGRIGPLDRPDAAFPHPRTARRESTTKMPWEQLEMQQHAEKLEQERKANRITAKKPSDGPWWKPEPGLAPADHELRSMRNRARPPMLGSDLSFPRCRSPEQTRFDVTQGAAALRNQMCAERLVSQSKKSADGPALWCDASAMKDVVMTGTSSSSSGGPGGLWGGFCSESAKQAAGGLNAPMMPTGLVTPRSDSTDPFQRAFALPHTVEPETVAVQTPPTPEDEPQLSDNALPKHELVVTQDELEQTLETEYPDSFVTQVYNYLSLGYPSLARPFDEELSKITHLSIVELRADDAKARASPRGYIRLGADFEGGGGIEREESCKRWVALRRYVHEWARQEKNMRKDSGPGARSAMAARRGSWGH